MQYKLGISLLLALAFVACGRKEHQAPAPAQLLLEINAAESRISSDEVASRLIQKDPALRLVDVRSKSEFENFTLPGAIHIPIADMLLPEMQKMLDADRYDLVFFSNDDVRAAQAWQINRRAGAVGARYMEGGLNEWTQKFLNPPVPPATASASEQEIYQFRKAVCQYFIGGSEALSPEPFPETVPVAAPAPAGKKTINIQPKPAAAPAPAKAKEEEGC